LRENNPELIQDDRLTRAAIGANKITFISQYRQLLGEFWFIETRGINLIDTQFLEEINPACTWCNNCNDILATYGIEATRFWQETETIEAGMTAVSQEHRSLLFDMTTRDGQVHATNRHGLEAMNFEFLTHSNFEENTINFIASSYSGSSDSLGGAAASIVTGNLLQAGTNFSELLYNPDLANSMEKRKIPPRAGRSAPRGPRK
jgi:DNA-directed RNA polymerase beta' subunit